MAFIVASEINQTSPYRVTQVDELSVAFVNQYGVRYIIGFVPDVFIINECGYYLYVVNEDDSAQQDSLVGDTIRAIVTNFFLNASQSVMLYICDVTDGKQALRSRLFRTWFSTSHQSNDYTLEIYNNTNSDGVEFFYGLLLRKDNPNYETIINAFYEFLSEY